MKEKTADEIKDKKIKIQAYGDGVAEMELVKDE